MQLQETGPFAFSASSAHTGAYTVVSPDSGDRDIDGQTAALKLYNTHTPFEDDQWVLTGLVYRRDLLDASLKLQRTILLSLGISLVLGIASILLAAKIITKPVTNPRAEAAGEQPEPRYPSQAARDHRDRRALRRHRAVKPKGVRLRFPPVQDTGTHRRGCGSLRI